MFFMTSIQAFITVVSAVLTFAEERALFLREKQKHLYHTSAYFLGRTAVDIALQTVLALIFGMFAYPMVGMQASGKKFFQFVLCLILVGQATHAYALIVGALIPFQTLALMLSPIVMVPFMMVTGFFVNNQVSLTQRVYPARAVGSSLPTPLTPARTCSSLPSPSPALPAAVNAVVAVLPAGGQPTEVHVRVDDGHRVRGPATHV